VAFFWLDVPADEALPQRQWYKQRDVIHNVFFPFGVEKPAGSLTSGGHRGQLRSIGASNLSASCSLTGAHSTVSLRAVQMAAKFGGYQLEI